MLFKNSKQNFQSLSPSLRHLILCAFISLLLIETSTSLHCYTSNQLKDGTEQMTKIKNQIVKLQTDMKTTDDDGSGDLKYLLGEGSFGQVFYISNHPDMAFKVMKTKTEVKDITKEIATTKAISELDKSLPEMRLAPHYKVTYCYIDSQLYANFYIVQERFLGSLENGATDDNMFSYKMKNLSYRMRFYHKLLVAFSVLYENGYKHCDIKPENIFYGISGMFKEDEEDNEEIALVVDQPEYFPVLADFGLTVKTDEACRGGTPSYYEPNEIKGHMPSTDNYRARIEMFSLALSIFQSEGLFFYRWFMRENLLNKHNWVPSWVGQIQIPEAIQKDIDSIDKKGPYYSLKVLMNQTLERVGNFNVIKGFVYSFADLQKEMVFYASVLLHYNQLANADKMEHVNLANGKQVSVFAQNNEIYKKFLDLLLQMVKDNDMFVGRPSLETTLQGFNEAAVNSSILDQLVKAKVKEMFNSQPMDSGFVNLSQISKNSSKYLI